MVSMFLWIAGLLMALFITLLTLSAASCDVDMSGVLIQGLLPCCEVRNIVLSVPTDQLAASVRLIP
jgi:hypothetical protein